MLSVKNVPGINKIAWTLGEIYSVLWVDLRWMRRNKLRTIATSLINPLLYLVAFGYGLGRDISFEGVSYLAFVIPGIIALTSLTSSFNGAASKLNVDRIFHKSFDELLMAPVSLFSIIVGKALAGVVRGMINCAALLCLAMVISPMLIISPTIIALIVLSCFVFSLLGVLAAFLSKSHQGLNTFNALVLLPMTFLSGTFFSLNDIPSVLKAALYALPLTHSSQCIRAAALGQPFPWLSLLVLAGFGVAFFVGCMVVLKRSSV
ncbi:MAG: ABC transporter permease [Candidatus Bathyarchaeia archaeon]|jgi:ABC-type multidrug transport system permease subunit